MTTLSDPALCARPGLDSRRLLLPYTLGLIALTIAAQLVVVEAGSTIGTAATVATGVIAAFYAGYLILRRDQLRRVRFGPLVLHGVTYVVVNGSFQLHAAFLAFTNSDRLRGDEHLPVDAGWLGPTFAMAGFWALGFIVHALASITQRGYES